MGAEKSIDDGSKCAASLIYGSTVYANMSQADQIASQDIIDEFNHTFGSSFTIDNIYTENFWAESHPITYTSIILSLLGLTGLVLFIFIIKNAWKYGLKYERFK